MSYLLDTNVICEATRPRPDPAVMEWLAAAEEDCLYLSAVTLAEVQRGVSRLAPGTRRQGIQRWLDEDVRERFGDRILPLDDAVASAWGRLMAEIESKGRPMDSLDGFIAATARAHDLTVVTRNVADFSPSVSRVLNPWRG
ncbi:MAG TPA: type II toxin-antitoxin system VapC family toxin [Opitutaceae bacterium]|nr:type II toxin-antitoxin system VapC family toxin [Opitutaceae bacterium]